VRLKETSMKKVYPPTAGLFGLLAVASLALWLGAGPGEGDLRWDIHSKKSVMTFAYKAYGNPAAGEGRYFLSKTVFSNAGAGPVRNLQVSYQIPETIPWTTPDRHPEILPGQTAVSLFYPEFPARVAALTSPTNATLEIRLTWEDGRGRAREEIVKRGFLLRGVNEFEVTSLPAAELVSWNDYYENDDLAAAFVTSDDPVVKLYAGEVARFAGGSTAGIAGGAREVVRVMEALYNFQLATGLRYVGSRWAPETLGEVKTTVQNVRLPREVILNGGGLCLELAMLWCAVMEHLGVKSYLVCTKGHAFAMMADQATGRMIPIECTDIGGEGIGGRRPFQEALRRGEEALRKAPLSGYVKILDIARLQNQGIRPPELPPADLKAVQEKLDKRQARAPHAPPPAPAGQAYSHPDGLFSFEMPASMQPRTDAVAQYLAIAPWLLFLAQDPRNGAAVEVYHWTAVQEIDAALAEWTLALQMIGAEGRVLSRRDITVAGHSGIHCSGETRRPQGRSSWTALYLATPRGVVGILVSNSSGAFDQVARTLRFQ
jgi:hypothetical protein